MTKKKDYLVGGLVAAPIIFSILHRSEMLNNSFFSLANFNLLNGAILTRWATVMGALIIGSTLCLAAKPCLGLWRDNQEAAIATQDSTTTATSLGGNLRANRPGLLAPIGETITGVFAAGSVVALTVLYGRAVNVAATSLAVTGLVLAAVAVLAVLVRAVSAYRDPDLRLSVTSINEQRPALSLL